MTLTTTTHLNFRGTAREALEFYARVFDGQAMVTTYADLGMPADAPGADTVVEVDSPLGPVSLTEPPRYTDPATEVAAGSLLAPMPGAVIRVAVSVGDTVTAGQPLLC
jgi:biotin carboxyl carrier protein